MKKEQLERDYGLRCGQHIQDAEGIMYLICNDLSGNVSILRIRDSVLFSGDEAMYLIEDIAKSLYFQQNKDSRDSGFIPNGGLSNVFASKGNFHSFEEALEDFRAEFGDVDFEIDEID